jgi:hypothetical protein
MWSKFRLLGAADAPHTHECTICGEKMQVYNKRQTNIPLVTEARRLVPAGTWRRNTQLT